MVGLIIIVLCSQIARNRSIAQLDYGPPVFKIGFAIIFKLSKEVGKKKPISISDNIKLSHYI